MEGLHVVGPFEGRWVIAGGMAGTASELVDAAVLADLHPGEELLFDHADVRGPVVEQSGRHHGHVRPDQQRLHDVATS